MEIAYLSKRAAVNLGRHQQCYTNYKNNSESFYRRTINLDWSENYNKFLSYLPPKAHILDAGCGVGRDAKYFRSKEMYVTAFDASEKMVELASIEAKMDVKYCRFQDLDFDQMFDGIWAQASLLHIPYSETRSVYEKMHRSLKPSGIFYGSYKYGNDHMPTPERDFYNMNEENIAPYFNGLFDVIEIWQEQDTRSQVNPSKEGKWLCFIVRKL